jgi:hypothetical protein
MSALDPSAGVVAAYGASVVPVSDRMFDLVETPLGAMTLLAGLRRQREGGPLNILVCRPEPLIFFIIIMNYPDLTRPSL